MTDTVDVSLAESVYLTLLDAQHKPIAAAADLVRALKTKTRTAVINPTRLKWHKRMPGSPFARCPKALIATTRLRLRFGLVRSVARKSGAIFWTELSPRCQPTLGGAAEDSTAIAVRKDGNLGRPHPR